MSEGKQFCDTSKLEDKKKLLKIWESKVGGKIPEDKLEIMVELQTAFLRHIYGRPRDYILPKPFPFPCGRYYTEKIQESLYFIGAIHNELEEIRDWLPWKNHKNYTGFKIEEEELKYEIIDCLHFLLNLALVWGMDPEELFYMFIHKNIINWERQDANY